MNLNLRLKGVFCLSVRCLAECNKMGKEENNKPGHTKFFLVKTR